MNELYLPYTATTNAENIGRLLKSIAQQRDLDQHLGQALQYKRYLFTDSISPLPEDVRLFFSGGIYESDPYVLTPGGRRFNMSALRNEAIRFGRKLEPAWTMLCDGDTVIEPKVFDPPHCEFAIPKVYYQPGPSENVVESYKKIKASTTNLFANGNSWWLLGREVLETFLFNEDFSGYGWEDNEFEFRVSGAGYHLVEVDFIVIHSWHPDAERRRIPAVVESNRSIARCVRRLIEKGVLHPCEAVPKMEVYRTRDSDGECHMVLTPTFKCVTRVRGDDGADLTSGRCKWNGDQLHVMWPYRGVEVYDRVGQTLIESRFREREKYIVLQSTSPA